MKTPSYEQCIKMLHEQNVPDTVKRHSIIVERVAYFLARKIFISGVALNVDLITSAALLHDISKISSMNSKEEHDIVGAILLEKLGYPEIAKIVSQHISLSSFDPRGPISEAEIVFYSDKRVKNEKIVSIDERYKYSLDKYRTVTDDLSNIQRLYRKAKDVEKKISRTASVDPKNLAKIT